MIYEKIRRGEKVALITKRGGASQFCKNKRRNSIREQNSRILFGLNRVVLLPLAQFQN